MRDNSRACGSLERVAHAHLHLARVGSEKSLFFDKSVLSYLPHTKTAGPAVRQRHIQSLIDLEMGSAALEGLHYQNQGIHVRQNLGGGRKVVKASGFMLGVLVTSMCIVPKNTFAQGDVAVAGGPRCFAIRMHLNGQDLAGPEMVTLKAQNIENTVSLQDKCFQLPSAMLQSELIDLSFTVSGNSIHLSDVPTDFFSGSWDIELADKKFPKDISVPKHANVAEVCALVFHGEKDQSLSQSQCRKALTAKQGN